MRLIIVTGGDEKSALSMLALAHSLKHVRQRTRFSMGCLDCGLTPSTRGRLASHFDQIAQAAWPFQLERTKSNLAAAAKCFLPSYFPGYDALAWIDPDSFVQGERLIAILSQACRNSGAAVVPAIDRSYHHTQQTTLRAVENFRLAFGDERARQLMIGPYIPAEVFAASASSPLWTLCQKRFEAALQTATEGELCFDAILHHVVYLESLRPHLLPSTCNWQSHLALPGLDTRQVKFVEPFYPFDPILAVSNTFDDKQQNHTFLTRDGRTIEAPLRYSTILEKPPHPVAASRS